MNIGCLWCTLYLLSGLLSEGYHDDIYNAVLVAINRSLVTLAESSGCDGQSIRVTSQMTDTLSPGGRTSFMRSDSPIRTFSATSEKSAPSSILSVLSDMTWTTEKTDEVTYLQWVIFLIEK